MLVCKYKMDCGEVFFAPLMNICNVLSSARSNYISGWLFNKKEQILWPKWLVYIIHQQINFCCCNWCSFKNEWWMSVCPFTVILGGLQDHIKEILRCRRLILIACGTSFHAGVAVGISLWYTRLNYSFPSSLLEAMIKQKTLHQMKKFCTWKQLWWYWASYWCPPFYFADCEDFLLLKAHFVPGLGFCSVTHPCCAQQFRSFSWQHRREIYVAEIIILKERCTSIKS